jgi:hypothetical protein
MITRQHPVVAAVMPRDVPICEVLDSFKPKARMKVLIGMAISQTEIVLVVSVGAFGLCLFTEKLRFQFKILFFLEIAKGWNLRHMTPQLEMIPY